MSEQIEQPEFFMVYKDGSDRNTPIYRHPNYNLALEQAKRLTRMHGAKFYVLCQVATVELNDLKVSELEMNRIPF